MEELGDWNGTCWSETTIVSSGPMQPPGMMPQQVQPPPMAMPQQQMPQPVRAVQEPMQEPLPAMPYYGPPPMPQPVRAVHGMGDAETLRTRHTLGLSLVLVPLIGLGGLYYGGPFGGVAGIFIGGAAVNAFRAARNVTQGQPETDREAMVSGTYAVLGLAVGGYLAWRIYDQKHSHKPATRSPVGI